MFPARGTLRKIKGANGSRGARMKRRRYRRIRCPAGDELSSNRDSELYLLPSSLGVAEATAARQVRSKVLYTDKRRKHATAVR